MGDQLLEDPGDFEIDVGRDGQRFGIGQDHAPLLYLVPDLNIDLRAAGDARDAVTFAHLRRDGGRLSGFVHGRILWLTGYLRHHIIV